MSTLSELNALRVAIGKAPLKAWKESKAKLAEAIKKLAAKSSTETAPASDLATPSGANTEAKKPAPAAKKQAVKKTPKKAQAKAPAKKVEGVTLSTIAEEIGMNPKVARAKLRRAYADADGTGTKEGRWTFTEAQAVKIKELLKGDARKKKD